MATTPAMWLYMDPFLSSKYVRVIRVFSLKTANKECNKKKIKIHLTSILCLLGLSDDPNSVNS